MADWIDYEDIVRYEKKNHLLGGVSHFIVGVYEGVKELAEKSKPSFVLRFYTEDKSNLFFDEANRKVKEERDYVKKSTTNFLGIEENIRKIAEKILLSSYPKRELYARISTKLGQKKHPPLSLQQNKTLIYSLIGSHPEFTNFLRKSKIQAYDIEKKRYDEFLREESLTNMAEVVEPGREHVVEGYSEKRKFDGVVPRRQGLRDQAKDSNPGVKCHEELYIAKIPERSQLQIDQTLGLEQDLQKMEIEQKPMKDLPISYRAQKVKIPAKDYGILNKEVQRVQREQVAVPQTLDRNLLLSIEAVKFMYQLMRVNARERVLHGLTEGPMEKVLDCLKDILTECERRPEDKRLIENKAVIELLAKANKNYLEYRRNPVKFY